MKALLVVFFVSTAEATHPATVAAIRATREVLGPDHALEVRHLDLAESGERALVTGNVLRAATLVELSWEGTGHRQARLRFHLEPRAQWQERVLGFQDGDDLEERGRTIGYVIASMIPDTDVIREGSAPTDDARPAARPGLVPRPPLVRDQRMEPSSTSIARIFGGAPPHLSKRGAVDIVGAGAVGVEGDASGIGGAASARFDVRGPLALRFGLSARSGQVTRVQAASLLLHGSAGLAWTFLPATSANRWEFGARVSGLILREQLSHFDSEDLEVVRSRWLPGAEAAFETGWFFSSSAAFLASVGSEVAFGRTDVTMHQEHVTTIPPLRLVLQLGVRAGF